MPPQIATLVFIIGVIGLFWLDRREDSGVSKAMLLPLIWLWLTSSRSVTEWVAFAGYGSRPTADQATAYMEGTPLDRNVLICLMVLALAILIKRGKLGTLIQKNLPVILFLVFAASSAIWSEFPDVTIRRWFKAAGCVLMVMVVLSESDWEAAIKRLFVWAGFLLIPHSILLIKYYPAIGRMYNRWTWEMSVVGVTTHKNSLGGLCQLYGIVFVWHFLEALKNRELPHRTRHLVAHGMAIAMVIWLFAKANSVTAQSCFMLSTAFLLATSTVRLVRKKWWVQSVFAALVLVPISVLFLGLGGGALEGMGRDSTLTGRTDIWARVISLVDNPILGTGFESFWLGHRLVSMHNYQLGLNEAHNGFIEIWISLGWVGVLLLMVMIVGGYIRIMKSFSQDFDWGSFKTAILLSVIVSSFTEAAYRTDSVSWISLLLVTMVTPQVLPQSVHSHESPIPSSGTVAPSKRLLGEVDPRGYGGKKRKVLA